MPWWAWLLIGLAVGAHAGLARYARLCWRVGKDRQLSECSERVESMEWGWPPR